MRKVKLKIVLPKVFIALLAIIFLLWAVFPLLWMILSSFKIPKELYNIPPTIFSTNLTLEHYNQFFIQRGGLKHLYNSVIASVVSMAIALILGSFAGYALARGKIPGKHDIAYWMITTRMAPVVAVILPFYIMFSKFKILYSLYSLILVYTSINLAFATWLLWGFFESIPKELEEAALCDGTTKFGSFIRVALPLAKPGLAVTAILCFMFAWNDYMFGYVLTSGDSMTLPVIAARFLTGHRAVPWGQVACAGSVVFIPVVFAGFLVRRYLIRGLTLGAIK
jgi:multiple sugar transport system permease protein